MPLFEVPHEFYIWAGFLPGSVEGIFWWESYMGAKLEDVRNGASVRGIASAQPVQIVSVDWIGDQAINVVSIATITARSQNPFSIGTTSVRG